MNLRHALLFTSLLCAAPLALADADADVDGQALYKEHCAKCHGSDGLATTWRGYLFFARDFVDADWQQRQTDARILRRINDGPGIMPAFEKSLTLAEREALVQGVRSFRPQ